MKLWWVVYTFICIERARCNWWVSWKESNPRFGESMTGRRKKKWENRSATT